MKVYSGLLVADTTKEVDTFLGVAMPTGTTLEDIIVGLGALCEPFKEGVDVSDKSLIVGVVGGHPVHIPH